MALTPEDIALHKRLIRSYEIQADLAAIDFYTAAVRLKAAETAIRNEKTLLRSEGVDI